MTRKATRMTEFINVTEVKPGDIMDDGRWVREVKVMSLNTYITFAHKEVSGATVQCRYSNWQTVAILNDHDEELAGINAVAHLI
jgi:hypothetical protein